MRHSNRRVRRDCCAIPSVSRRPRRSVCPRRSPEKARPHHAAQIGPHRPLPAEDPCARVVRGSETFSDHDEIFLHRVSLPSKESHFEALLIRGSKPGPSGGSTGAPDHQSQGLLGCAVQATLERGVRDILHSVQGQSRVPRRGIPSRESIEPSNPTEWVRAPPSEPSRALYETCLRTTSRPLSNGARTSA